MATKTRDQMIAEFLAQKGATKCPPAASFAAQASPLSRLRAETERRLAAPEIDEEVAYVERETQRRYLALQGIKD